MIAISARSKLVKGAGIKWRMMSTGGKIIFQRVVPTRSRVGASNCQHVFWPCAVVSGISFIFATSSLYLSAGHNQRILLASIYRQHCWGVGKSTCWQFEPSPMRPLYIYIYVKGLWERGGGGGREGRRGGWAKYQYVGSCFPSLQPVLNAFLQLRLCTRIFI